MVLENKTILITGGTGSFGQKFLEMALKDHNPAAIRVFSRGELGQEQVRQHFNDDRRLRFLIGDIRDRDRLERAMKGVDIVIHAAALKQLPVCEYNPIEAIRTNILGTVNVIDAAIDNDVEKVITLSTDKAVNPTSLYGATKLCAEKLFVQGNAYVGKGRTRMSCVRYGNVIASRGSVVPLFREQARSGVITITDERMSRFWITLEQAVNFLIDCLERMRGGEIFIPKLASMRIIDLAEVIAPEAEKRIVGIRIGEKLSEILLTEEEAGHTLELEDYFVVLPEHPFWSKDTIAGGTPVPEGFRYSSGENHQWLSKEEMREMLKVV